MPKLIGTYDATGPRREAVRTIKHEQHLKDQRGDLGGKDNAEGDKHSEAREGGSTVRRNHYLLRKGNDLPLTTHDEHQITQGARTERRERDKNG